MGINGLPNNETSNNYIPISLHFFSIFSVAWVYQWKYEYVQQTQLPPLLVRQGYSKWWSTFNKNFIQPANIQGWFQKNPRSIKPGDNQTSQFLQQKSISAAKLASITDKQEYIKQLKDILLQLDQSKEASKKEEASSPEINLGEYVGPDNEDDCYGIFSHISN